MKRPRRSNIQHRTMTRRMMTFEHTHRRHTTSITDGCTRKGTATRLAPERRQHHPGRCPTPTTKYDADDSKQQEGRKRRRLRPSRDGYGECKTDPPIRHRPAAATHQAKQPKLNKPSRETASYRRETSNRKRAGKRAPGTGTTKGKWTETASPTPRRRNAPVAAA